MSQITSYLASALDIIKNAKNRGGISYDQPVIEPTPAPEPVTPEPTGTPAPTNTTGNETLPSQNTGSWLSGLAASPIGDLVGWVADGVTGDNVNFENDSFGRAIGTHYLFGNGEPMVIVNDPGWTAYMQSNEILSADLNNRAGQTATGMFTDYQNLSIPEGQPYITQIDETYNMEIENGEGAIGYQYLHGTNADVGGFQREGTATMIENPDGTYTVTMDMTYTWNDIMDPNPIYSTDVEKAEDAQNIPFANPSDFEFHLTWQETTVVQLDANGNVISVGAPEPAPTPEMQPAPEPSSN
jgi:hypothetical protein